MMRLINADSLKELYEGFGEYEDSLVVPIAVILQNIDDMPTIAMINESILSKSLKEEKFAPVTWGDGYAPDGSEIIDMWECPGGSTCEVCNRNYSNQFKPKPKKTRQDEFLELYPDANVFHIKPCSIEDKNFINEYCAKYDHCLDCANDYWLQEVEK